MAFWTVKTHYKKSCSQHEYFTQSDGDGRIKVTDGFRYCEYRIETDDDKFPEFEFTYVPGGDGKKDSLDLNNVCDNNIVESEMIEMFDGGCWFEIDFEGIEDEEEEERLREKILEEGSYSIEDDGEWYLDETEVWVWGPLEIINEETKERRIIIADENGKIVDFKEDEHGY